MNIDMFLIDNIRSIFNIEPIEGWNNSKYDLIISPINYTISYNNPNNIFYQINNGFMLFLQLYWIEETYKAFPKSVQINDLVIDKDLLYNKLRVKIKNSKVIIDILNSNIEGINVSKIFIELEYNTGGQTNNLLHNVQNYMKLNIDLLYNLFQGSFKTKYVISTTNIVENIFNLLELV